MDYREITRPNLDNPKLREFYKDKTILVLGGVGSIGREITRQLLDYDPKVVRVLDNNETGLYELERQLEDRRLRLFVGDVRDAPRVAMSMERADLVFHAAALKHVPLCEYNPFEAIKTNIMGTQNVIDGALENNLEKMIFVSTDKAAGTVNVMGATKLLGEKITTAANRYVGLKRTRFACVRFGNVLNSRGSVVPLIREQVARGYATVMDPAMTRFIMTIQKAVELTLKAGMMARGGETFIFKMPAVVVEDLVRAVIEVESKHLGKDPESVEVRIIGKRPGERRDEELMTTFESENAYESGDMFVLNPPEPSKGLKRSEVREYSSGNAPKLGLAEIKELLEEVLARS